MSMLTIDINTIPHSPGVYLFRRKSTILYAGKASDLKNRLASYFRSKTSEKVRRLREEATSLEIITLASEIEALIKEAELIKRHVPKFNVLMRDDKNYAYAAITDEPFPHIFVTHQPASRINKQKYTRLVPPLMRGRLGGVEVRRGNTTPNPSYTRRGTERNKFYSGSSPSIGGYSPLLRYQREVRRGIGEGNITPTPSYTRRGIKHQTRESYQHKQTKLDFISIGPYTSSVSLKITLKLLRKLFPYCTCVAPHTCTCLNAQIGLCPGYCCTRSAVPHGRESSHKEYRAHIQAIISVLTGKGRHIIQDLKKRMSSCVKTQHFEQAAILRNQAIGIENVLAHRLHLTRTPSKKKNKSLLWRATEKNIIMALGIPSTIISRVEGYDISHVSGANPTGSMVVVTDGMANHDNYRMFKIKTVVGISDVDMLREVVRRRLAHREWQFPDLMVIDGGKPQLNAVMTVIRAHAPELTRRVVALAKRKEELYSPHIAHTIRLDSLPPETGFFFQRIRDESHRFAKRYHHKLREISYRPSQHL